MGRKKVGAIRANGTIETGRMFTDISGKLGDPLRGSVNGQQRVLTFDHAGELTCLAAITREWRDNEFVPWTVRHYYYVLTNAGLLKSYKGMPGVFRNSSDNAYNWVVSLLADARETHHWGASSWDVVVDQKTQRGSYYNTGPVSRYVRWLARQSYEYTADLWRGQPHRIVLATEKAGLYAALERAGDPYGVPVFAALGGFGSVSAKHAVALDLVDFVSGGQETVLLYVGDHDPAGISIEEDFGDALRRYGYPGAMPVRVAVTLAQALAAPTTARQYVSDDNAKNAKYVDATGLDYGIQVEALSGQDLTRLVRDAIEAEMDLDALEDARAVENAVGNFLTDEIQAVFARDEAREGALDRRLMSAIGSGALLDPRTNDPLPLSLIQQYLPDDVIEN